MAEHGVPARAAWKGGQARTAGHGPTWPRRQAQRLAVGRPVQLAVCVPPRHAAGFRALNAGLKKRAFRLDSDHLVWADVEAGV